MTFRKKSMNVIYHIHMLKTYGHHNICRKSIGQNSASIPDKISEPTRHGRAFSHPIKGVSENPAGGTMLNSGRPNAFPPEIGNLFWAPLFWWFLRKRRTSRLGREKDDFLLTGDTIVYVEILVGFVIKKSC